MFLFPKNKCRARICVTSLKITIFGSDYTYTESTVVDTLPTIMLSRALIFGYSMKVMIKE